MSKLVRLEKSSKSIHNLSYRLRPGQLTLSKAIRTHQTLSLNLNRNEICFYLLGYLFDGFDGLHISFPLSLCLAESAISVVRAAQ